MVESTNVERHDLFLCPWVFALQKNYVELEKWGILFLYINIIKDILGCIWIGKKFLVL